MNKTKGFDYKEFEKEAGQPRSKPGNLSREVGQPSSKLRNPIFFVLLRQIFAFRQRQKEEEFKLTTDFAHFRAESAFRQR